MDKEARWIGQVHARLGRATGWHSAVQARVGITVVQKVVAGIRTGLG